MAEEATQTDTVNSEATTEAPATATPETTETVAGDEGTALGGAPSKADEGVEPTEQAAEAAALPEKYELSLEGANIDPAMVEVADPVFRELGLDNDAANKLMPVAQKFADQTRDATLQSVQDAAKQQTADWLKIARTDEVIGNDKWNETQDLAAKGMDALGFDQAHPFRTFLNETGLGNHRDMLFAMRRVGELVAEDSFERGEGAGGGSVDIAKQMYPND